MNQSKQIGKLLAALSKAQACMNGAKEDSNNPFYKSSYADLTSVWTAAREPLTNNGLSVTQTLEMDNGHQMLVTILGHSSGQWMRSSLAFPEGQKDPQAIGKVITYYRRYMLAAIVGVCPEDDDAEKAMTPYRHNSISQQSFIRKDQADEILELIGDDKVFLDRLLAYYKVKALTEIDSKNLAYITERSLYNNKKKTATA